MELNSAGLDPRYRHLLESCEPYLVTFPGNLPGLDLSPFGRKIGRVYDPTRLSSREVVDGLHHLDAFSFGDQEMLMPRWVLFDCGEFPGLVFGFGREAALLPDDVREAYRVTAKVHDHSFVPLSMWVAIRCAEESAWFGHNLSSANLVAKTEPLPGLATLTKVFGVKTTACRRQYGATQWDSESIGIHMSLGQMELLCAFTPAHTHPETFAYRMHVSDQALAAPLDLGWKRASEGGTRSIDAGDRLAILALQMEIEAGTQLKLVRIERRSGRPQRLWLDVIG